MGVLIVGDSPRHMVGSLIRGESLRHRVGGLITGGFPQTQCGWSYNRRIPSDTGQVVL